MSAGADDLPFSVAWLSHRLYRVTADHGPSGQSVEVDGWSDALDTAWEQLVGTRPEVVRWYADYRDRRGDEALAVVFDDSRRVVGRRSQGAFTVSYPTDRLLAGRDQVAAMRAVILVVLDRHVATCALDVPLLSSWVGA